MFTQHHLSVSQQICCVLMSSIRTFCWTRCCSHCKQCQTCICYIFTTCFSATVSYILCLAGVLGQQYYYLLLLTMISYIAMLMGLVRMCRMRKLAIVTNSWRSTMCIANWTPPIATMLCKVYSMLMQRCLPQWLLQYTSHRQKEHVWLYISTNVSANKKMCLHVLFACTDAHFSNPMGRIRLKVFAKLSLRCCCAAELRWPFAVVGAACTEVVSIWPWSRLRFPDDFSSLFVWPSCTWLLFFVVCTRQRWSNDFWVDDRLVEWCQQALSSVLCRNPSVQLGTIALSLTA